MPNFSSAIAIIDDDDIFQLLIRKIVEPKIDGNFLLQFPTAAKALAYFKVNTSADIQRLPSIIFLDLVMPQMSGWEFLEHFEKLPFNRTYRPPIFILTASGNIDFEKLRNYSLVKGFLTKPIVPAEFLGLIRDVIEQNSEDGQQGLPRW